MTDGKTRIVIMGSGGSGGVPYSGNVWGKCDPNNPKNKRTRPSIYVTDGTTKIVVDTSPEFRQQINATGHMGKLDAVLYTHVHADHVAGIDDLRALWHSCGKQPIDVYGTPDVLAELAFRYNYLFETKHALYPALVTPHVMRPELEIGSMKIRSFDQEHSIVPTLGFRIGDFVYSTDTLRLPQASFDIIKGCKTWVIGAHVDDEWSDGGGHAGLNTILKWADYIKPEQIYLTHLNALADYDDLCRKLPAHIRPAYDGLELFI